MTMGPEDTDEIFDETEDLDDMHFFDDDESVPTTAQGFSDWLEPSQESPSEDIEEEEEIIPDVQSQKLDWDTWFKE